MTQADHQRRSFSAERLRRVAELEDWHFWFVGRRALLHRLISRNLLNKDGLILDIGCGTGSLVRGLLGQGHHVLGIDVRPEGLRRVGALTPDSSLVQADALCIPLSAGSVDLVLMLDVLEHVADRAALEEISRVLRPGGKAILTAPAMPWLWSYRDEDAGHIRRYTRGQLHALAASASLVVVETRHYQFFLLPLLILTRFAGRKSPRMRDLEEQRFPLISDLLTLVSRAEVWWGRFIRWPIGASLVAVCRKPE